MNEEELKQRLIELLDELYKRERIVSFEQIAETFIENGVTIRECGEWQFKEEEAFWIDDIEEIEKTGKPTKRKLPFCPSCKTEFGSIAQDYSFCPHCGVDMRGGKDE